MRLATANETTSMTSKVITNNNRTRALTMQYWEVLRLFDVSTVVDDVSLVCMVPLDVVDFLPEHQPAQLLGTAALDRAGVLYRYGKLLRHSDVLSRRIPWRLRRGLQALNDFAADPRATVQPPTGAAMRKITVSDEGGFMLLDRPTVQLMLRNGIRTAAVTLGSPQPTGSAGMAPLPTRENAYTDETALFADLRNRRAQSVTLTAEIALPESVALQDIVGLAIQNSVSRLDYSFAPAGIDLAKALLTGNPLTSALAGIIKQPSISRSYGPDRVIREIGDLMVSHVTATVNVNASNTSLLGSSGWTDRMTVPGTGLIVPTLRMAPELSYDSLLGIERTLQWVLRNTMDCSLAVIAAMTPEERTVMLERYSVTAPTLGKDGRVIEGVPLLSCITNKVLGFYGNSIVMPFQIPFELAARLKVDTGRIQRALKRFHTESFDHPVSTMALPTRGVLGEAVLGSCPAAEKIDLTRFWNWKDSPTDKVAEITSVPADNLLSGVTAPNALASMTPIINNFSTQGPGSADSGLVSALVSKMEGIDKPFDVGGLTNSGNLKSIIEKTTDTAEGARKDALSASKEITLKAMELAAKIKGAEVPEKDVPPPDPPKPTPTPTPTPPSATDTVPEAPAARPQPLTVFFNLDKVDLVDVTAEGRSGQDKAIDDFVAAAKACKATAVLVRGYASPEGTMQRNRELVGKRADALAAALRSKLNGATPSVTVTTAFGGVISGPPSQQYPELRRAEAAVTASAP